MKQLFQALARSGDGAFIIDEQQQIVFWNQAAQKILGFTAEEIINHPCYEVLGGRDEFKRTLCQRYCRVAITILQGHSMPDMDIYARTKEGDRRWINVTTLAYPTGNHNLGQVIVHLFRDATQKKHNERFIEEIMAATKELRKENGPSSLSTIPAEAPSDPGFEALTPREREVLILLANGLGTDEIADMLNISPATTRNHIQSVLDKLHVHSRLEAVAYAYQHGLIDMNEK